MTNLSQKGKKITPKKEGSTGWFYFNVVIRVMQSLILVGISLMLMLGALGAGIGLGYFAYLVKDTDPPTKQELQQDLGNITETSKLAYADNSSIATIRSDLFRTSIPSDQISDWLKKAVVATEDEYFYEHKGVVPKAVLRALISEVTGIGSSGGSTLTQQLVKQQILSDETTFKRKANEILLAMEVEKNFSKDEIIAMYLNISPFGRNNLGQNIAGVQEAAQGIFGINASDVNLPQAAFIAGLPQSPISYSPYTNSGDFQDNLEYGLNRKDFVLFSMYRNHDISKKEYEEALAYDLTADFKPKGTPDNDEQGFLYNTVMGEALKIVAKQLADEAKVSAEDFATDEVYQDYLQKAEFKLANGGYTVQSTIDKDLYQSMQEAVQNYGYMLDNGSSIEVGNVLMENNTGKILGFIGGRDYASNPYNHAFSSKRQAGSAIKPVSVYAPALDQGLVGSESRVSDYPTNWEFGEDAGSPIMNATNAGSKTFQTVRETIVHSNNIPARHLYQEVLNEMGSPTFVYDNYLKEMNYPDTPVWQYESAPMGVMELTTLAQTNGFQTLANKGVYQEGYIIESIKDSKGNVLYQHEAAPVQVFSPATASIMNDLMRSVLTEAVTTPFLSNLKNLDWNLGNADWVGKTGTTDEYVDSWLVVSTPKVTLSSWSGREDNKPTDQDAGRRTAQYMAYLANSIYQTKPDVIGVNDKFELDSNVNTYQVSKFTGTKPGGKVTVNNRSISVPNETVASYWAKGGPANASFKFGIGGTDANYADYWKKAIPTPSNQRRATPPKKEKKEEKKKED
ncbi:transglycosylase [Enterococcus sp. CU12B]|uniref:Transglycosylase n=1 Tax=Candidatus Enterococcus willemsii TaxID=1857215 RepID=A0ABQ6Z2T9_9ENTE|nr:transglycosylase [Enterococcus sp. CU12B]